MQWKALYVFGSLPYAHSHGSIPELLVLVCPIFLLVSCYLVGQGIHHCPWVHIYILISNHFFFHTKWITKCLLGRSIFPYNGLSKPSLSRALLQLLSIFITHPQAKLPICEPKSNVVFLSQLVLRSTNSPMCTAFSRVDDRGVWPTCLYSLFMPSDPISAWSHILHFHLMTDCCWVVPTLWLGGSDRPRSWWGSSGYTVACYPIFCHCQAPHLYQSRACCEWCLLLCCTWHGLALDVCVIIFSCAFQSTPCRSLPHHQHL